MMPRDVKARLAELGARAAANAPEPEPPKPKPLRKPRRRTALAQRCILPLADLLEQFTPASAYAFIHERTVPPGEEDGLALIASYPELSAAAPELVADMAVAFRYKQRSDYAEFFKLCARAHGIESAP